MSFYVSLLATASARFHSAAGSIPAFYVQDSSGSFTLQFTSRVSHEERLAVADRLAAAAAEWRDSLAEQLEQERTQADELAEARAEIARLKGETGGACGVDLGPGYTCQRAAGHDGDHEPTPDLGGAA